MKPHDLANIRRVVRRAGLEPPEGIDALEDEHGTTARLYRLSIGGRDHVAKVVDDPTLGPRAARECAVLSALETRLDHLAPRLVAFDIARPTVVLVIEHVDGRKLSGREPLESDVVDQVLAALTGVWSITEGEIAAMGLDLPSWGRGRGVGGDHDRRVERFRRRADSFLTNHPGRARAHRTILERTGRILDAVAARRVDRPRLVEPRVIHGDLHADNVILGARGPRILDWQTASLGDPLEDLVRFELESRAAPRFADLEASAGRLPPNPPSRREIADAAVACYAGLISGFAGRTSDRRSAHENLILDRLLAPDQLPPIVAEALDHAEAVPRTVPTRRGPG